MPLSIRTDRHLIRAAGHSTRYLLASIVAPTAPSRAERHPVNVALVLDRSGSMDGERKFGLAREAVEKALRLLRPEDRFALVIYDEEVEVLSPAAQATAEAKHLALSRLRAVGPRGSTDLHAGWTTGAEQITETLRGGTVSRVLLLTDGLANHGITDHRALVARAAELRRLGVPTSTFGVGADFDEVLLRDIAHEGGGNFYFIESPAQIADLLTSELGEALEVVARDAELHAAMPLGVVAAPLNRLRFAGGRGEPLRIGLGDLVSAQELRVVLKLRFPAGAVGESVAVGVQLTDRDGVVSGPVEACEWRFADHRDNEAQPRDSVVDREVAGLYAARARAEATEANRAGDLERARRVLEQTADRIRGYAYGDPALEAVHRSLLDDVDRYAARAMSPMQLKSELYVAESFRKGRGPDGKARRRQ